MAVNKVVFGGNTLIDLTGVTVTPETLGEGVTSLDASGELIVGTMTGGGNDGEEAAASILSNTITELDNSIATSLRSRALQGATKLVTVNLPAVTSMGTYAFYSCAGLTTVHMPLVTSIPSQCFYGCSKLKHADFGRITSIAAQAFHTDNVLTELIIRKNDSICTLSNTTAISNTAIGKGTGYVYVPAALVDSYKAASNWSTFADQFRALEDYTVDGTITGELDTSKI